MTATLVGFYVALAYAAAIFFKGFGISLGHHIRDNEPDLHAFMRADHGGGRDHPASVWIAAKLDAKREKSRKPRA